MISQRKAIFVNESFQVRILILFFNKDTQNSPKQKIYNEMRFFFFLCNQWKRQSSNQHLVNNVHVNQTKVGN